MTTTNEQPIFDADAPEECQICCEVGHFTDAQNPLMRCRAKCSGVFHADCVLIHVTNEQASEAYRRRRGYALESCPFCKVEYPVIHLGMDKHKIAKILPERPLRMLGHLSKKLDERGKAEAHHLKTSGPLEAADFTEFFEKARADYREEVMPAVEHCIVPRAREFMKTVELLPELPQQAAEKIKEVFDRERENTILMIIETDKDKLNEKFQVMFQNFEKIKIDHYKKFGLDKKKFLKKSSDQLKEEMECSLFWEEMCRIVTYQLKNYSKRCDWEDKRVSDLLGNEYLTREKIVNFKATVMKALGISQSLQPQLSDVPAEALGGGPAGAQEAGAALEAPAQAEQQVSPWLAQALARMAVEYDEFMTRIRVNTNEMLGRLGLSPLREDSHDDSPSMPTGQGQTAAQEAEGAPEAAQEAPAQASPSPLLLEARREVRALTNHYRSQLDLSPINEDPTQDLPGEGQAAPRPAEGGPAPASLAQQDTESDSEPSGFTTALREFESIYTEYLNLPPRRRQRRDVEHDEVDGRPARRQRREDGSA